VGRTLIILAAIVAAALIVAVIVYVAHRGTQTPVVRRRELRRVRAELHATRDALYDARNAAQNWHEVDSVLAGEISRIMLDYEKTRERLEKSED